MLGFVSFIWVGYMGIQHTLAGSQCCCEVGNNVCSADATAVTNPTVKVLLLHGGWLTAEAVYQVNCGSSESKKNNSQTA